MTKRIGLMLLAGLVCGLAASAMADDDLRTVEKKTIKAWDKHKSMTATMKMVAQQGPGAKSQGDGTFELMKKDGKLFSRVELKTVATYKMGEQEQKMETTMTVISDAEFNYALMTTMGRTMATKTKIDPDTSNDPRSMFEHYRKDHDLKLLPEEEVDGKKAYVIEATPKKKSSAAVSKMVLYFQQESGVLAKMVAQGPDGKPMSTISWSNIKLDVDLNPERFVFKAPPGVEVMDQTTTQP